MQAPERIFHPLELRQRDTFLDAGCGTGEYTLFAANVVGPTGNVFALDRQEDWFEAIHRQAKAEGFSNVTTMLADLARAIPLPDDSVDVCLLANVLHVPNLLAEAAGLFGELRRVLKPGGRLGVVECQASSPVGPPMHIRLSPEKVESLATAAGFRKIGYWDVEMNYLLQFAVSAGEADHA